MKKFFALIEDAWIRLRNRWMINVRHHQPKIIPYVSYGSTQSILIQLRVVLKKPKPATSVIRRGFPSLFVAQAPGARVNFTVDGTSHPGTLTTDRGGYITQYVPMDLAPGWHDICFELASDYQIPYKKQPKKDPVIAKTDATLTTAANKLLVVEKAAKLGIITDIDDTIMVSHVPTPIRAAYTLLTVSYRKRKHVSGMPEFFRYLREELPYAPFIYLSAAPWNLFSSLKRFIVSHKFPFGPIVLQDIGPSEDKLFESTRTHKMTKLAQLIRQFPDIKWMLIGDDGQHDVELYQTIAKEFFGHIHAIIVRELSAPEHIANVTIPSIPHGNRTAAVPIIYGPDGFALKELVQKYGVV